MSEVQGEGLVGLTEIESAARRLAGVAVRTPLLFADAVSDAVGAEVRLKCESLQRAGSFKIRGAYNFVSQLPDHQAEQGIITYSSGNHGQAGRMLPGCFASTRHSREPCIQAISARNASGDAFAWRFSAPSSVLFLPWR